MTERRKELEKEYRRLAKRADQRLVRIEKYAKDPKYKGLKAFAYRKAVQAIRAWSGEREKYRFNTKPPSNTNALKRKIKDIKRFLESDTSTLKGTNENRGLIEVYEKRTASLNDNYGTDFTWQELAKFFESGINEKLDKKYDSDTKMNAVREIRAKESEIRDQIEKNEEVHIEIEPDKKGRIDPVLQHTVNQILKDYGYRDIKELFT